MKRISAGGLNRGAPFMAVYEHPSSKTHIQITSSSPNGSSDTRMMAGRGRDGGLESGGAPLPFSYVPVDGFPPSVTPSFTIGSISVFSWAESHVT